jgi:uncharacterized membrane protein
MSVIEKSIEVDVPVSVAYNQWTQFEDFPAFMEGVENIEQLDDTRLRWHVSIGGVDRTFEARIEEQDPDRRISWRATEGEQQAGTVSFEPVDASRTRVHLEMSYDPQNLLEKAGDALNIIDRRVESDLERFKSFIEERGGDTTGAWRGEIGDSPAGRSPSTGQPTDPVPGAPGSDGPLTDGNSASSHRS